MRHTVWKDYELIDTSSGERLERWGTTVVIRPDPQVIWNTEKKDIRWQTADAVYHRSNTGGGHWEIKNKISDSWEICYNDLKFGIKMMNFKHMGVFPEQAVNWDLFEKIISLEKNQMNILNLFAYTGGATLACAKAGAKVCHVDASKGMVSWGRENALKSNLREAPIRWIVDDCEKFAAREIKRGNKYDGIIMDPPSYGRGPKGEIWKIEDNLYPFMVLCESLLSDNANFFVINSYSTGLSPSVMGYLLSKVIKEKRGGYVYADEIGIPVASSNLIMPAGSTAIWSSKRLLLEGE
jgi:23S rRNA (cytosine1962-C5)-methyltransferase